MKKELVQKIVFFVFILLFGISSFFGYKQYEIYKAEKQVQSINEIFKDSKINRDNCKVILDFKEDLIDNKNNKFYDSNRFKKFKNSCIEKYDIKNISLEENICKDIIKNNSSFFEDKFIILDDFDEIKNKCISKFLKVEFSTGSLFDIEKDFKSTININFSLDFFEDIDKSDKKKFIENRIQAKKRLLNLLVIEPKVDLNIDDIVLYKKRAILNLNLKPQEKYSFKLKEFDFGLGKKLNSKVFILNTPENKFFGFKINKKVTLFADTMQPKFTFYKYNTDKREAKLRICRVDNENYSKIEVYDSFPNINLRKDFFKTGIDKIKAFNCKTKVLDLTGTGELMKKEFDFSKEIGISARSGLYYIDFDKKEDREFNGKIQRPIIFGIIDSHITMKVSANKEAFFFINDFSGKPLANQEIRVYLNNFKSKKKKFDYINGKYIDKTIYYSPFEKSVLSKAIYLGKTNSKGILKVDLNGKINNVLEKTLGSGNYDWDGNFNSLFVTSASKTNLSYVSSKYNGGITPWNFGYSVGSWWYGENSENDNAIVLNPWGQEKKILAHIFTDRKLYLPGEDVQIKAILRNTSDLSIPKNKKINLIVKDSKNKELLNTYIFTNEYGSINQTIKLSKKSPLGNYFINLKYLGEDIVNSTFSVEIFKNPKFKTEVMLKTDGLNGELVKINDTKIEKKYGWEQKTYKGNFNIKADIFSKYYSGPIVKNTNFTYKVYKQYYYDNSYWDDCYFGCYGEPQKEFYTEGKGVLDENGKASFDIPVKFSSSYDDYKYIVEVTVKDKAGDIISSSNSIIAKLPQEYKKWDSNSGIKFKTEKRFYKVGEEINITGRLQNGKFSNYYNDKFLLLIKRKDYKNTEVLDLRGKKVNKITFDEVLEKRLKVNTSNFKLNSDGSISLKYKVKIPGEYVFEYGKIIENKKEVYSDKKGEQKFEKIDKNSKEKFIINPDNKKYFTIVAYGDTNAKNPIVSDNKIRVLSEKVSYHIGEKARILIRLPSSKGKILLTKEKLGVVSSELISVKSNIFFKEFIVDDSFAPNTYIGVLFIPEIIDGKIPEYKVGYTEIVVDKTDKKAFVDIESNKKIYKPREKVSLDINIKNKNGKGISSELTVMVVDDSLISLMGNVDLNTLEKFYKKLPFRIQTAITNIAMLKNYYFTRRGIVGGSGFGNFKGGDSAVSSRNIFKNTAYYNANVITDYNGKAYVEFNLPDNLTNFRIMVVANSKKNFFGMGQKFIEVRKNVIVQDKTPFILREGDISLIGAQIFNNTKKTIGFKVDIDSNLKIENKIKNIYIDAGKSKFVNWEIKVPKDIKNIDYTIKALGDSIDNSDKISGKIEIKESPVLITNTIKNLLVGKYDRKTGKGAGEVSIDIPANTDISKSKVEVIFSNNRLVGIDKIVSSLAHYPYGCIEQTISSTYPNAILLKFSKIFGNIINKKEAEKNLKAGIDRLETMQLASGGFSYWQGDSSETSLKINAYVLSAMLEMQKVYKSEKLNKLIQKSISYLEKQFIKNNKNIVNKADNIISETSDNLILEKSDNEKKERNSFNKELIDLFYVLNKSGKKVELKISKDEINNLYAYNLIKYTYGLYYSDKNIFSEQIKENITRIKELFKNDNEYNSYYSNNINNKALFTQLLLDLGYNDEYIDKLITDLYYKNWSSYYYSTKTKANTFLAFAKYLKKNSVNKINKFAFSIGTEFNERKIFSVGGKDIIKKIDYNLGDLLLTGERKLDFKGINFNNGNLYVDFILKQYPKDKKEVKPYSNKVKISRKIYEVVDEVMMDECNNYWYYGSYYKDSKLCDRALVLVKDNIFKKGNLYLIKNEVNFSTSGDKKNFVIEDYQAGSFRILNSKFKTEGVLLKQNQNNWFWSHIEYKPNVVMANSRYIWGDKREFSYFIRPEFTGKYTLPPTTGYFMYNPLIRANSGFDIIEVK